MITLSKINPHKFKLRVENLVMDLNDSQIVQLRGLCDSALKNNVVCRCCGTVKLEWQQVKGKWLLFDNGKLHDCPVKPLPELDPDRCDWI